VLTKLSKIKSAQSQQRTFNLLLVGFPSKTEIRLFQIKSRRSLSSWRGPPHSTPLAKTAGAWAISISKSQWVLLAARSHLITFLIVGFTS